MLEMQSCVPECAFWIFVWFVNMSPKSKVRLMMEKKRMMMQAVTLRLGME
jgi:hypothetical protein